MKPYDWNQLVAPPWTPYIGDDTYYGGELPAVTVYGPKSHVKQKNETEPQEKPEKYKVAKQLAKGWGDNIGKTIDTYQAILGYLIDNPITHPVVSAPLVQTLFSALTPTKYGRLLEDTAGAVIDIAQGKSPRSIHHPFDYTGPDMIWTGNEKWDNRINFLANLDFGAKGGKTGYKGYKSKATPKLAATAAENTIQDLANMAPELFETPIDLLLSNGKKGIDYVNAVDKMGNPLYPQLKSLYDRIDEYTTRLNFPNPEDFRDLFNKLPVVHDISPEWRNNGYSKFGVEVGIGQYLKSDIPHLTRQNIDALLTHEFSHQIQNYADHWNWRIFPHDLSLYDLRKSPEIKVVRDSYDNPIASKTFSNPDIPYEQAKHALGVYPWSPKGSTKEVASNTSALKSKYGWTEGNWPSIEEFIEKALLPENAKSSYKSISHDIVPYLTDPKVVSNKNAFVYDMLNKAPILTLPIILETLKIMKMKKIEDYYLTDEEFEKRYGMSAEEFAERARPILEELHQEVLEMKRRNFIFNELYEEAKKYTSNPREMNTFEITGFIKKHNPSFFETLKEKVAAQDFENYEPWPRKELKDQKEND